MSLGTPGPGGKPKGSIFSSLSPAPAPAAKPAPAPRPAPAPAPAPRPAPAADPEAIAVMKRKMEELEKKLGEQQRTPSAPVYYPAPPAPARGPEYEQLCKKIEDLERRLSDFSHSIAISSEQLKSIEESKVNSRREIGELIKTVQEQQKYADLDRQLHEQLERALPRAEELEKKLMDFYSSVLALETRRREETARASDKTADAIGLLAQRLESLVGLLAQRLESLEKKIQERSPLAGLRAAQEDFLRRAQEEALRQAAVQEAFRNDIIARLDKQAAGTPAGELRAAQEEFFTRAREEEQRQAAANEDSRLEMVEGVKENSQAFKEIFENHVRVELELLRNKVYGETEALRREMTAAADESRKFLSEQSAFASEKAAAFEEIARANVVKTEGVDAALDAAARRQAEALEEFSRRRQAEARAMNAEFSAAVKAENDARFEKFGAKYADALLSVTFVENFRAAISESLVKFENYGGQLASFLKEVSPAQLEKVSGVSGMMIRRQFSAMTAMMDTLKAETSRLRDIKLGVEEKFGDIFKER